MPDGDPTLLIEGPKVKAKRNKPQVDTKEAQLLTETRYTKRDGTALSTDMRDRCIIALARGTGLRVSEVASLNAGMVLNMNPSTREFFYIGKGGAEYSWYLTADVYDMLHSFLSHENITDPSCPLFANRDGTRLSVRSIQKIIAKRGQQVLGKAVHPHMLRRGYGNEFYEKSGKDIYATKEALHHNSVTTTEGYLGIGKDRLKIIVDGMSAKRAPTDF